MNRRSLFKGAFASLFAFMGAKLVVETFKEVEESDVRVYRITGKCDLNSLGTEDYT